MYFHIYKKHYPAIPIQFILICLVSFGMEIDIAINTGYFMKFSFRDLLFTFKLYIAIVRIHCAASWENRIFAYVKTKAQISFAVTAKLISALVFTTRIVQFLYFQNFKLLAFSETAQAVLCRTWSETPNTGFLAPRLHLFTDRDSCRTWSKHQRQVFS